MRPGVTAEYKDKKLIKYRDPTFDIDLIQSTMSHQYPDDPSRNDGDKRAIASRGIAMTAGTSTCYNCGKMRHYAWNCKHKSTGAHDKRTKKGSS